MATSSGLASAKPSRVFRGCSSIADYEVLGKLGEGTFGEVHKARDRKSGRVYAIKKILMHNEKDGFPITALREIKLLKMISHVNILQLTEMAIERAQSNTGTYTKAIVYMVTPYMDHDLSGLLENPDVKLTEPQIKCYMLQLLDGACFLHANHILHRDMKAANLLINNKGILQIADFGLARYYDGPPPKPGQGGGEAPRDYTQLVVTRWYRPPELLLGLRRYTTAIDMWGVGCIFAEMFERSPILAGKSDLNQAHLIFDLLGTPNEENMPGWNSLAGFEGEKEFKPKRDGNIDKRFAKLSPPALSLLKNLLCLNWKTRLNAHDALRHAYFITPPLPAQPGDLPSYKASHELDRRRFREMKDEPAGALPPAPAGGSVGNDSGNDWYGAPEMNDRRRYRERDRPRDDRYRGSGGPPRYDDRRGYDRDRPNYDRDRPPPYDRDRPRDHDRDRERERDRRPDYDRERPYDDRPRDDRRAPPQYDARRETRHPGPSDRERPPPAWARAPRPENALPPRPPAPQGDPNMSRKSDGGLQRGKDTYIPSYQREGGRGGAGSSGGARDRERSRSRSPARERERKVDSNPYARR